MISDTVQYAIYYLYTMPDILYCVVRDRDNRITCDEEFSDSEDEGNDAGGRKDNHNYKHSTKRPVSFFICCQFISFHLKRKFRKLEFWSRFQYPGPS